MDDLRDDTDGMVVDPRIKPGPKNPVAEFVDDYGDTRVIHRKQGRRLSVFNGGNTAALQMNRAISILLGRNIRKRRIEMGLSMKQLSLRAGLQNVNPKQYIHSLENSTRGQVMRFGTLFALAHALDCEPTSLLPKMDEVMALAQVKPLSVRPLVAD